MVLNKKAGEKNKKADEKVKNDPGMDFLDSVFKRSTSVSGPVPRRDTFPPGKEGDIAFSEAYKRFAEEALR